MTLPSDRLTVKAGAVASLTGTLALAGSTVLRNRLLGRAPPYAAHTLATRLAGRLGWKLSSGGAQVAGGLMRLGYGTALGLLFTRLGGRWAVHHPTVAGGMLGAAVLLFEHLAFPWLGVTPPASRWTRAERVLLAAQTSLYGLVTARVYQLSATRRRTPSAVTAPSGAARAR
jgi:hypothetical protein